MAISPLTPAERDRVLALLNSYTVSELIELERALRRSGYHKLAREVDEIGQRRGTEQNTPAPEPAAEPTRSLSDRALGVACTQARALHKVKDALVDRLHDRLNAANPAGTPVTLDPLDVVLAITLLDPQYDLDTALVKGHA